ncbi:amidohydrolase family protein [Nonomuraea sp. K274]|uniref:Amidohydrolase family protein n=1 Tax=Nonomuraea cypriaca TaxID=1187855 RepID=A0A931A402_9ACTN|nr:amidohydrolase family protein [Nonomuraea cypriaca]MBF8185776.1 amidohydrolase family protein [Nonomuraea cypriaca]
MRTIDVHAHVFPPALVTAARAGDAPDGIRTEHVDGQEWVVHRQGYRYPLAAAFHDVEARLGDMDAMGIDLAVLSPAPTLFLYWTEEGVDAARVVNDAVATMVAQAPDRFAGLGTLPLRDPAAAVAELRRCAALGLRGAQIGPHVEGTPLDDAALRPVLAAAEELRLPLTIHPYYVGSTPGLDDFYLTNLQGNPWQTAVCASRLILSGALDALPGLDLVLVHGGGHLPYQIGRLDHGRRVRPETRGCREAPSAYLRRFHYDTLTHSGAATGWLIDLVGADRVLYGTDMPFDMGGGPLDSQLGPGHRAHRAGIAHRNAERLYSLKEGTS